MTAVAGELRLAEGAEIVSSLTLRPRNAAGMLILGHGAGAGMRHAGMESLSVALARENVATFRFQFPYMERGRRFPDPLPLRLAAVGAAVTHCESEHGDLVLFAGGRSMGGRMASTWCADHGPSTVRGLVFFGFPLHPPGKPGTSRADHLKRVEIPMLFLQGTRDKLAGLDLLEPVCASLGRRAQLHIVDGADHGFHVLKRSGRSREDVLQELAHATRMFVRARAG